MSKDTIFASDHTCVLDEGLSWAEVGLLACSTVAEASWRSRSLHCIELAEAIPDEAETRSPEQSDE